MSALSEAVGVRKTSAEHGAALLNETCHWLDRFVVFPSHAQRDAAALWVATTHARDYHQTMVWEAHPILGFLALTPNAGKSTATMVVAHLSYGDDVGMDVNPSARGMLQAINEDHQPIIIDNMDRWAVGNANGDAHAIIVAGYKFGARKRIFNRKWNLYEAKCVNAVDAELRNNPHMEDVMSRMIVVHMRRKRADQHPETWKSRLHDEDAARTRAALTSWGKRMAGHLANAWPEVPEGVTDGRAIELWTPLLAVGEACGPQWAERARQACRALALSDPEALDDTPVMSAEETLLAALAEVLDPREDTVMTRHLVPRLQSSSFAWQAGKPLRAASMELSRRLAPLGVGPVPYWDPEVGSVQGYRYADFVEHDLLPDVVALLDDPDDPRNLPL